MHSATETSAAELINRSTDYGQQTTDFVQSFIERVSVCLQLAGNIDAFFL